MDGRPGPDRIWPAASTPVKMGFRRFRRRRQCSCTSTRQFWDPDDRASRVGVLEMTGILARTGFPENVGIPMIDQVESEFWKWPGFSQEPGFPKMLEIFEGIEFLMGAIESSFERIDVCLVLLFYVLSF